MSDPLGEALALWDQGRREEYLTVPIVAAARDHLTCLQDWITCPTCGGSGKLVSLKVDKTKHPMRPEPIGETACPDCVDGMIPAPDAVMRVAVVLADHDTVLVEDAPDIYLPLARRVLLAFRGSHD